MGCITKKTTKWAASWQNQQNGMCAQGRLRSAWASAQSDQSLRCPHEESLGPQLPIEHTLKTLITPRLIWVFAGCTVILLVLPWGSSNDHCAQQRHTDQPGHTPSLIWVFAVRMKKPYIDHPLSAQWRLNQADLCLRWTQWSFYWFCHPAAQMMLSLLTNRHSFLTQYPFTNPRDFDI